MKVAILHLSDIHFQANIEKNEIIDRINKITQAVLASSSTIDSWFVVISGDIAYSGIKEEYLVAKEFIKKLRDELTSKIKFGQKIEFIIIPGNHDCNFSQPSGLRDLIITSVKTDSITEEIYTQALMAQKYFFDFWDDVFSITDEPWIYKCSSYNVGQKEITFHLLNSSWMSSFDEKQGKLLFPINVLNLEQGDIQQKQSDIVITLLHHPYSWFEEATAKSLRKTLENNSDIILTGHEHESDIYIKDRITGQRVEYIEGGILQSNRSEVLSQFNLLLIDFENKSNNLSIYTWNNKASIYEPLNSITSPLFQNPFRNQNSYILNPSFEKELNDPGVKFTNLYKDEISLDDIFIYPQLRKVNSSGNKEINKTVIKERIPEFIIDNKKILVIGSEKSGKTALCRTLFKELMKKGFIPLLITGSEVREYTEIRLFSCLNRGFELNYKSPTITLFSQLEKSKKALIIDDFDKCPLNTKGKNQVLDLLLDKFEIVILTGNETLRFEGLADKTGDNLSFWNLLPCEIMEFGRVKRAELIRKWHEIGRLYTIDESELSQKIVRDEKLITSLIGKNFIPSFPLFILIILQQLELKKPVETTSGSYGYLYEALLTTALTQKALKKITLDMLYGYLTEFAYFLFDHKREGMNKEDLLLWHTQFCALYSLQIDLENVITILCEASVLQEIENEVTFRYPYMRYYFVARYFRDHMGEEIIRANINNMCRRLHHIESANVIIFLCYLSKDPFILNTLLEASTNIFSNYKECNIIDNSKFLDRIFTDIPQLVADRESNENNHKMILSEVDNLEDEENEIIVFESQEIYEDKLDKDLQEFAQINVAFKTIQILGQLVRNFPGSLRGEQKYKLALACYSLGLRVIEFIFEIIQENKEEMVQGLAEFLRKKHVRWPFEKLTNEIGNVLFSMMENLSFAIIKHVSDSIGLDILSITFSELVNKNDNISYKFIDLSVRLDYYQRFPEKEVIDLFKTTRKNNFAVSLLRHLVWYYLFIYNVKRELREGICKKLGIQLRPGLPGDQQFKKLKS